MIDYDSLQYWYNKQKMKIACNVTFFPFDTRLETLLYNIGEWFIKLSLKKASKRAYKLLCKQQPDFVKAIKDSTHLDINKYLLLRSE